VSAPAGPEHAAAGAFKTEITGDEKGKAIIKWEKVEAWRSWASLSQGCYLLRSNVRRMSKAATAAGAKPMACRHHS
jgi:hypothetical protein